MARPEASPFYPPRARWYAGIFRVGDAFRRRLARDRLTMPRTMKTGEIIAGFFVPGLAVWLRGPALWGRAALFLCAELLFVFVVWLGYPLANFAFGLLLSAHCSGFVYYCSPLMAKEEFGGRLAFTFAVLLLLGLLLYLPALHFVQHYLLTPLRMNGQVYVVQHLSRPGVMHRGDWVAYSFDPNAVGENHHGSTVELRDGISLGAVLAVSGDEVTFTNGFFYVKGARHVSLPHMPVSGSFIVAGKHWFIWPNLGISQYGNVGETRLSDALMGLADVPETNYFGKPFHRWFWRKQILP
ncbi:MAG TPA: hypothetical protein VF988_14265 [Verrucomicrobiae bacterium]